MGLDFFQANPAASAPFLAGIATWDVATAYLLDDEVLYDDGTDIRLYTAISGSTGSQPDITPLDWEEVSPPATDGNGLYDGSGTVPTSTVASLTNTLTIKAASDSNSAGFILTNVNDDVILSTATNGWVGVGDNPVRQNLSGLSKFTAYASSARFFDVSGNATVRINTDVNGSNVFSIVNSGTSPGLLNIVSTATGGGRFQVDYRSHVSIGAGNIAISPLANTSLYISSDTGGASGYAIQAVDSSLGILHQLRDDGRASWGTTISTSATYAFGGSIEIDGGGAASTIHVKNSSSGTQLKFQNGNLPASSVSLKFTSIPGWTYTAGAYTVNANHRFDKTGSAAIYTNNSEAGLWLQGVNSTSGGIFIGANGNMGLGTSLVGTDGEHVFSVINDVAPTTGVAGGSSMYSADIGGLGYAAMHFINENDDIRMMLVDAGWTAPTGTATKTTFVTGTVTLPVLAEHVKALIDHFFADGTIKA